MQLKVSVLELTAHFENNPCVWYLGGAQKKRSSSLTRMSNKLASSAELENAQKEEKAGG